LRFSSIPHAATVNVADREYFRQLKDGASTAISPQLDERLSHQQVFIIGRRIEMDGNFRGVATISAIPPSTGVQSLDLREINLLRRWIHHPAVTVLSRIHCSAA